MEKISRLEALNFHSKGRPGKIEVIPSKSHNSQYDLSLAYSPGVAEPCKSIARNKKDVYKYTSKGNLVAVISNGSAVLGLGNIGPEAAKPVMEGKGLLFKIYADIDVFDIEMDASDVDLFVQTVKSISPTFGGINLEDIKAPECFEIERRLKRELDIPVMHDDQHGTAIISSAALINALEIAKKKIDKVKVVVNGAGAAAISCLKLYVSLGLKKENIFLFDSKGIVDYKRKDLTKHKLQFATKKNIKNLKHAMRNADVFIGLSVANVLTQTMLKSMKKNPIVFAMANPDPEISYDSAMKARKDLIMATGRSDYPNQVNNVLGFPYIFRGALDVRATSINERMKIAAVKSIASLAKESVPEEVLLAYDQTNIVFGPEYIIPKPNDPRLISEVSPAVAKAAIKSGVAQIEINDWEAYQNTLRERLGIGSKLIRNITRTAKIKKKKIVFPEGHSPKILKAVQEIISEDICQPVLLGNKVIINANLEEYGLNLNNVEIIDPKSEDQKELREDFSKKYWQLRNRFGITMNESKRRVRDRNFFGSFMVEEGLADGMVTGVTRNYPESLKPALQVIGLQKNVKKVAGLYIALSNDGPIFFSDTTINKSPEEQELIDIILLTAKEVRRFGIKPVIALLSYSNFGSVRDKETKKLRNVINFFHKNHPNLLIDGEIQANFALNNEKRKEQFPHSKLKNESVNTLIFPNLDSGNISYKLLQELSSYETIGPILLGMKKPAYIVQLESSVKEIVNITKIVAAAAQTKRNKL
ncbi:MAG: NADP-dependent malic enzyme [Flavobacteriales bacterium]|nr:NADP-dependent malic enzyme [Flavobacteriales bacterium]|tara:strand:+ start:2244 stop:4520 length:2277 start_codon:yes stop_codon:yes gene_type:complete